MLFAVLILVVVMSIGLTLAAIFFPKLRSIGDAVASVNAISAADSAMEWCLFNQRKDWPPSPPAPPNELVMSNGATHHLYYPPNTLISGCARTQTPLNHRAVGTYKGVGRSYVLTVTP